MRVFKTKWFNKWMLKEGLTNKDLILAVEEIEKGLIDANLGGNVYKKRVAKAGQGKSGSTRTIIAFRIEDKAFFIYGFAKNDKDNITNKELEAFKILSNDVLNYSDEKITRLLLTKELVEVLYE
jgi:hypothetical protein